MGTQLENVDDVAFKQPVEINLAQPSVFSDASSTFFRDLHAIAAMTMPSDFPVMMITGDGLPDAKGPKEGQSKADSVVKEYGKWTEQTDKQSTFKAKDGTVWTTTYGEKSDIVDIKTPDGTTYHVAEDNKLTVTDPKGNKSTYDASVMQYRGSGASVSYPAEANFSFYRGNERSHPTSATFASGGELKKISNFIKAPTVTYATLGKAEGGKLSDTADGSKSFSAKDGTEFVKAKDGGLKVKFDGGTLEIDAAKSKFKLVDKNGKTTEGKIKEGEFSVKGLQCELETENGWTGLKMISSGAKLNPMHTISFSDKNFAYQKYFDIREY